MTHCEINNDSEKEFELDKLLLFVSTASFSLKLFSQCSHGS